MRRVSGGGREEGEKSVIRGVCPTDEQDGNPREGLPSCAGILKVATIVMTYNSDLPAAAKPDRARRRGDDAPCEPGRRLGDRLGRERRDLDPRGSLLADRVVLTGARVGLDPETLLGIEEVRRDLAEVLDGELEAGVCGRG